jgi:tetratricopeptide (TPR) repeat protein
MSGSRPSICLCMIVRNEVDVLSDCIHSCRGLIDRWVICDTGSTDGTQALIARELAHIPGELHERDWLNFAHNRTELMKLARGKADYLLLLDADTTLEAKPRSLAALNADSYLLRHSEQNRYYTKRLVRGDLDWLYVGVVHEYISCADDVATERLDDVVIHSRSVGGLRKGRWERDAQLLEAEVERCPSDGRALFYLAQTYRDLGNQSDDPTKLNLALNLYQLRAQMPGWAEETYVAWYHVGVLSSRLGDWPRAANAFLTAWDQRPTRLEALHELAVGLRARGQHRAAHRFTQLAAATPPPSVPTDLLFVATWIYEWGLLFEHSINTFWCGESEASILAAKRLLAVETLPESYRSQIHKNLQHSFRERARQSAASPMPPIRRVPHTGTATLGHSTRSR